MKQEIVEILVKLRAAVGVLGEHGPRPRWPSAFATASSRAFLSPLFPRTLHLSQLRGVISAASRVHDERIGVGDVYHLFRLPEEIEQAVHRLMLTPPGTAAFAAAAADPSAATSTLASLAAGVTAQAVGPARIGGTEEMGDKAAWQKVAGQYAYGFKADTEVFPFFSAK